MRHPTLSKIILLALATIFITSSIVWSAPSFYLRQRSALERTESTKLAEQLRGTITTEGIEGWVAIAERAQQLAGEKHPNLVAALEVVKSKDYNRVAVAGLVEEVKDLTKQHKLTPDETAVVRLCLGLDWGQGSSEEEYPPYLRRNVIFESI